MKIWIGVGILAVLVVIGNTAGSHENGQPQAQIRSTTSTDASDSSIVDVAQPLDVDLVKLIQTFSQNQLRADDLYGKRRVRVTGWVEYIRKDQEDRIVMKLSARSQVMNDDVLCFFDADQHGSLVEVGRLTRVRVSGRCRKEPGCNVCLEHCRLD